MKSSRLLRSDFIVKSVSCTVISLIAAHIDIMPTFSMPAMCKSPPGVQFDGVNLVPLLNGKVSQDEWADRYLFCQGYPTVEKPEKGRCFMVRDQQYQLVQQVGLWGYGINKVPEEEFLYELFDMSASSSETANIAAQHPDIVRKMNQAYEQWYYDVGNGHDYSWPKFEIGTSHENPMYFYQYAGVWPNAKVVTAGKYDITALIPNRLPEKDMVGHFTLGETHATVPLRAGATQYEFKGVYINIRR